MKKKQQWKKSLALLTVVLLILSSLNACGASKADVREGYAVDSAESVAGKSGTGALSDLTDEPGASSGRKIIEYVTLDIETREFDTLNPRINEMVAQCGGYIQSSDVSGDNAYSRYARYVVRIPTGKKAEFTQFISDNSNVVHNTVNTEDVTLSYVDTESRIKALTAEKEAYEQLMEKAATVEDIATVQERLSDVIYELESYQSKLRTYDSLVEYTTVTLNISEVERTTVVEKQTVWQKIGTNLKENFVNVWEFLVGLFVFLISAIPYLLLIAVAVVIVLLIIRAVRRKKAKRGKKRKAAPETQTPPENPDTLPFEKE